jgi:hypothetical protein
MNALNIKKLFYNEGFGSTTFFLSKNYQKIIVKSSGTKEIFGNYIPKVIDIYTNNGIHIELDFFSLYFDSYGFPIINIFNENYYFLTFNWNTTNFKQLELDMLKHWDLKFY